MNRGPFRLLSGALSESGYPPEPVMGFNPGDSELILSKISVKMYLCHDLAVSFVHYTFKSCILYLKKSWERRESNLGPLGEKQV